MNSKSIRLLISAIATGALSTSAAFADPTQQSALGTSADGGNAPTSDQSAVQTDATQSQPIDAAGASSTGTTSGAQPPVHPGPLLEARKELFSQIQRAGQRGIGTANYLMAFSALEGQVAAGASENQIRPRVEQLSNALKDQLTRAQVLKTQRPLPPTASQQADGNAGTAAPTAGTPAVPPQGAASAAGLLGGGENKDAIIEKLKQKFGTSEIPGGGDISKLLNSDKARELLKRFGQ